MALRPARHRLRLRRFWKLDSRSLPGTADEISDKYTQKKTNGCQPIDDSWRPTNNGFWGGARWIRHWVVAPKPVTVPSQRFKSIFGTKKGQVASGFADLLSTS